MMLPRTSVMSESSNTGNVNSNRDLDRKNLESSHDVSVCIL